MFLQQAAAAVAATLARPARAAGPNAEALDFLRSHFVADLHTHTALKTSFFKKDLFSEHPTPPNTYPFTLRTGLPALKAGGVDAVFAAIYVPEPQVPEDAGLLSAVGSLNPSVRRMKRSLREDPAELALRLMDEFDAGLRSGSGAVRVRSLDELDQANRKGQTAFLYTLEGGRALGGPDTALDMLRKLHARGVCMATLAHFYDTGLAPNIQGIPKTWYLKALGCFGDQWASEHNTAGLPELGRQCVETMHELGMLVDLTHMTPEARADVYDQTGQRAPLVMSHVGCRDLAPFRMNPTAGEIRRIADTGGVVGVIFLNYFLDGSRRGKGIDAILETMQCVMNHGGEDGVAWASDFDGLTNPPNDLTGPSELYRLVQRMLDRFGERATAKILGGNVRRVLREGWRPPA